MYQQNAPIYLWGFMASGKSRLGKRLSKVINRTYIDLDQYIETQEQQTIPEIFHKHGEQHFRKLEQTYLHQVSQQSNLIIACGGGTPCYFDNKSYMLANGVCVFLTVERQILIERLWANREKRPLVANMQTQQELQVYLQAKLKERMPYYAQAHFEYNNTYPRTKLTNLADAIAEFFEDGIRL